MIFKEIFEFYYTTDAYPVRLKPLSKEELRRGMSSEAVEKYLSLIGELYNAFFYDVNSKVEPRSVEERYQKSFNRSKIYNSLIKHLFKVDAISEDAYCELHSTEPVEFDYVEHPSMPGKYVSDSLDDFRWAFDSLVTVCCSEAIAW